MAVRRIVLLGEEILREPGVEVEAFDDELRSLVADMQETMYFAEGIGLAAPQIGVSLRVCVLDLRDEDDPEAGRWVLVNPVVVESSDEEDKAPEGCLSVPDMEDVVTRPARVTVSGFDAQGEAVEIEADELLARALQHEIDHLDGVLFIDHLSTFKRRALLKKWKKSQKEGAKG
ncbi:MAG TPA: peptide deformylase [Gemmatimonadetes bacterium]|nr:peptide deformylase [Gemmatimonadota bacterium]